MSEKKEKKTAEKTEADIQAGIAALAEAILALDEPAEIAEVPEEEHPHGKKEAADKDPRTREEKLMVLSAKGNVLRLLPPLNVSAAECDEALEKLGKAFAKAAK